MPTNPPKIVVVDDEKTALKLAESALSHYDLALFDDPKKALQHCLNKPFDLLISDQKMKGISGLELIRQVRAKKDDFLALVLSAHTEADIMVEAVNSKLLYQYLVKPVEIAQLEAAVKEALDYLARLRHERKALKDQEAENQQLRRENTKLRLNVESPLDAIYGSHPLMVRLKEQIKTFALSDHPVLISGEPGTGKKLCAQVIHQLSPRRNGPFVHFAASHYDLGQQERIAVELFGSVKSGGKPEREGFIHRAHGGTLYITDLASLDKTIQGKLLRLLNYGTYYNVGGEMEKEADVRLIFATGPDLIKEVQTGKIHKELFLRINTLHIKCPPLRERRSDIIGLIDFLARRQALQFPQLSQEALEFFTRYLYPGNVRELEGIMEKVTALSRNQRSTALALSDLQSIFNEQIEVYHKLQGESSVIRTIQLPLGDESYNFKEFIRSIEKELIKSALEAHNLNISQTARVLMISRQGLKNKMKRYGLEGYDDSESEEDSSETLEEDEED